MPQLLTESLTQGYLTTRYAPCVGKEQNVKNVVAHMLDDHQPGVAVLLAKTHPGNVDISRPISGTIIKS